MRKITKALILRQIDSTFPEIRKGDIFALEIQEEGKPPAQTEWAVALENAQQNPQDKSEYFIPGDKVYFIVGKPEIHKIVLTGEEIKKQIDPQIN